MKILQAGVGVVVPSNGSGNGRARGGIVASGAANEDEELQAAIEASMSGGRPSKEAAAVVKAPAVVVKAAAEPEPPAKSAGPRPEEVAAEAATRLPEEPSGPEGCRIGKQKVSF